MKLLKIKLFKIKCRVHFTDGKTEVIEPFQMEELMREIKNSPNLKFFTWMLEGEKIPYLLFNINNITKINIIRVLNI